MTEEFYIQQLETIIHRYPADKVNIVGVILDYIGRTEKRLDEVCSMNTKIYRTLFLGDDIAEGKQLVRSQIKTQEDAEKLREETKDIFPVIESFVRDVESEIISLEKQNIPDENLFSNPPDYLEHGVDAIIWQLSDVHFGKYNKLENNPRELASLIAKTASDFPLLKPDLIVISGDLTSVAAIDEFGKFGEFCEALSGFIWGRNVPQRILVVPGNHDVAWLGDGNADKMQRFQTELVGKGFCITPFGNDSEEFEDGKILVKRFETDNEFVPPFALVNYQDYDLEILLLVSGYFSGKVPEEVQGLLGGVESREALQNLLRVDEGAVSREYNLCLSNLPEASTQTRLGVIHHHPIQYGIEPCHNKFAPQLLETLFKKNVPLLLHGHVHLTEDFASCRPPMSGRTYPIPCSTLTSICTSGDRGMNIHLIGKKNGIKEMTTLYWNISTSSDFKKEGLMKRYKSSIHADKIMVTHGA